MLGSLRDKSFLLTRWVKSCIVPCCPRLDYCNCATCISHWWMSPLYPSASHWGFGPAKTATAGLLDGISQRHWPLEFPGCQWSLVIPLYELSSLTPDLNNRPDDIQQIVTNMSDIFTYFSFLCLLFIPFLFTFATFYANKDFC